jgi:signal peptidase II
LLRRFWDYLILCLVAGGVIALDQWTKSLVRARLQFGEIWTPYQWLEPYARIVHWKNTGAAFGMLPGFSDLFTILAIVVAVAILYYLPQIPQQDWLLRLALGLQLGGAVGNLIDRLTIGSVTDFISIGSFPVFNIADASISTGVVVLLLGIWWKERQQKASPLPEDANSSTETLPESREDVR